VWYIINTGIQMVKAAGWRRGLRCDAIHMAWSKVEA